MEGGEIGVCVAMSGDPVCGATAPVPAEGRSSEGVDRSASNVASIMRSDMPTGTDQRVQREAETIRSKICRLRDKDPGGDRGGGVSPCHSHKPVSRLSALIDFTSDITNRPPFSRPQIIRRWKTAACSQPNRPACSHAIMTRCSTLSLRVTRVKTVQTRSIVSGSTRVGSLAEDANRRISSRGRTIHADVPETEVYAVSM